MTLTEVASQRRQPSAAFNGGRCVANLSKSPSQSRSNSPAWSSEVKLFALRSNCCGAPRAIGSASAEGRDMAVGGLRFDEFQLGAHVYTLDGAELGTVADSTPSAFKVSASLAPDFWLSRDCIRLASSDEVRVDFDQEDLDARKLEQPPAE